MHHAFTLFLLVLNGALFGANLTSGIMSGFGLLTTLALVLAAVAIVLLFLVLLANLEES